MSANNPKIGENNQNSSTGDTRSRRKFMGTVAAGTGSAMLAGCSTFTRVPPKLRTPGALVGTVPSTKGGGRKPPDAFPNVLDVRQLVKWDFDRFVYEIKRLLEDGCTEEQLRSRWIRKYPHSVKTRDVWRNLGIIEPTLKVVRKGIRIVGIEVTGCMLRGGDPAHPEDFDRPIHASDCAHAADIANFAILDGDYHVIVSSSSSSSSSW